MVSSYPQTLKKGLPTAVARGASSMPLHLSYFLSYFFPQIFALFDSPSYLCYRMGEMPQKFDFYGSDIWFVTFSCVWSNAGLAVFSSWIISYGRYQSTSSVQNYFDARVLYLGVLGWSKEYCTSVANFMRM